MDSLAVIETKLDALRDQKRWMQSKCTSVILCRGPSYPWRCTLVSCTILEFASSPLLSLSAIAASGNGGAESEKHEVYDVPLLPVFTHLREVPSTQEAWDGQLLGINNNNVYTLTCIYLICLRCLPYIQVIEWVSEWWPKPYY